MSTPYGPLRILASFMTDHHFYYYLPFAFISSFSTLMNYPAHLPAIWVCTFPHLIYLRTSKKFLSFPFLIRSNHMPQLFQPSCNICYRVMSFIQFHQILGLVKWGHQTYLDMSVFWYMTPCTLVDAYKRFVRIFCLHHHSLHTSALKMEAAHSSKALVNIPYYTRSCPRGQ
jgi:hypothetical protein